MIAPASKLLWAAALIVVPLCAMAAFAPLPAAVGLLAAGLVAAWDARQSLQLLRQLRISLPERVTWFQGRDSSLSFELANASARAQQVRVFLALPGNMPNGLAGETHTVPPSATTSGLPAACTPSERGRFLLTHAELQVASPLQLWHAHAVCPATSEIRVYPDLREDRASLLLARQSSGTQRQRQLGKGREFEKLRDYLPGDSFDEIHWRASARHGKPIVKVTQVERTQQVYVVLDSSRLSARHGVLDRFVHAALGLAMAAETQGDRFGLVLFSNQVDAFVRAGSGRAHFAACRDAIYTVQPRRVSPDFDELFSFLQLRIRTRSLLLFLTALDDPLLAEMFLKSMRIVARRHLLMVSVPHLSGARPLFTGDLPSQPEEIYANLAGHMQWTQLRALAGTLERAGVKLTSVDLRRATSDLARQYFDVKRRQLL